MATSKERQIERDKKIAQALEEIVKVKEIVIKLAEKAKVKIEDE